MILTAEKSDEQLMPVNHYTIWPPEPVVDESEITAFLWLDASYIVGLSDGDTLDVWLDRTEFANNAIQTDPDKRLTYKVNQINGRPAMQAATSGKCMVVPFIETNYYFFGFLVAVQDPSAPLFIEYGPDADSNNGFYIYGSNNTMMKVSGGTIRPYLYGTPNWMGSDWCIVEFGLPANMLMTTLNGIPNNPGTNSQYPLADAGIRTDLNIFSRNQTSRFTIGSIAELILFKGVMRLGQRTKIMRYLGSKYNISVL